MTAARIDALVLGRDCHARAFTGEARLWLAGTRVFGPAAIVMRSTQTVSVPDMTWNPARLAEMLRAVPGLTEARRIGVDGMGPAAFVLLRSVVPDATFEDATPMLRTLLRVKSEDEIDALRAAARVARDALAEMARALEPGVTPARLRARFARAAGDRGVTTPAFEATATNPGGSTWMSPRDDPLDLAAPVVLRGGVLRDGWEASLARTSLRGVTLTPAGWDDAVQGCRPGADVARLPITHGVGRGLEPLDPDVRLEAGMVVAVELDAGGVLRQDVVVIGAGAPEVLTAAGEPGHTDRVVPPG
jgi:Xaa-Pro aminopeptidase